MINHLQLSTFIVHMIGEYPTTIEDFVSMFHTQQIPNLTQDTQLSILLEVLAGIPEEVSVIKIVIDFAYFLHHRHNINLYLFIIFSRR